MGERPEAVAESIPEVFFKYIPPPIWFFYVLEILIRKCGSGAPR